MASWKSMTKVAGAGAGSESICQRHGSADQDPYQNVTDSQHCDQAFSMPTLGVRDDKFGKILCVVNLLKAHTMPYRWPSWSSAGIRGRTRWTSGRASAQRWLRSWGRHFFYHFCYTQPHPEIETPDSSGFTDKKENEIFLIYREIQMGFVRKPYMRKGFLIYIRKGANI